jgi:hypothetical protein
MDRYNRLSIAEKALIEAEIGRHLTETTQSNAWGDDPRTAMEKYTTEQRIALSEPREVTRLREQQEQAESVYRHLVKPDRDKVDAQIQLELEDEAGFYEATWEESMPPVERQQFINERRVYYSEHPGELQRVLHRDDSLQPGMRQALEQFNRDGSVVERSATTFPFLRKERSHLLG